MTVHDFAGLMSDLMRLKAKEHRDKSKAISGDAGYAHHGAAEALESFALLMVERAARLPAEQRSNDCQHKWVDGTSPEERRRMLRVSVCKFCGHKRTEDLGKPPGGL
jgi:hypothetical protein